MSPLDGIETGPTISSYEPSRVYWVVAIEPELFTDSAEPVLPENDFQASIENASNAVLAEMKNCFSYIGQNGFEKEFTGLKFTTS